MHMKTQILQPVSIEWLPVHVEQQVDAHVMKEKQVQVDEFAEIAVAANSA